MPKKPNTPQIATPTSRSLKEAWDKECTRLKYSVPGITYPGDVQKALIALLLCDPDKESRDEMVRLGREKYDAHWGEEDSIESAISKGFTLGPATRLEIDSKGKDRLPINKRTPKGGS